MKVPLWVILAALGVIAGAVVLTRSVPYWVIFPFVVGWLAAEFATSPTASPRAKRRVVLVSVWTTAVAAVFPLAAIPAIVVLLGVGVFVALHHDLTSTR